MEDLTASVLTGLGHRRATWSRFHVHAEALRRARASVLVQQGLDAEQVAAELVERVLAASVQLTVPDDEDQPAELSRADGESVYSVHGSQTYTSMAVLEAEEQLLRAAATHGGFVVPGEVFQTALADVQIDHQVRLDASQVELARRFACGPHRVEVGIGPAGTGKTTAMAAFAAAVHAAGGRVLGLAPSAVAAGVLSKELGAPAETMHKLIDAHTRGHVPAELQLDERTVIVVDEAGMAGTLQLQAVLDLATQAGAAVRLLGDPAQLDAVGAGGVLRLIATTVQAAQLRDVYRFHTPGEDEAGLLLRDGRAAGLDFYIDNARVHTGSRQAALEEIFAAWVEDQAAGRHAIMIAATNDDVAALNARCRLHRTITGLVETDGTPLGDGTLAGVGDVIVTRYNQRSLRHGATDWVRNGDLWIITHRHDDGSLSVRHRAHRTSTRLPAAYVREHVQLGYATTIHRAQGLTVDVARVLVDSSLSREHLYTAITRGRHSNHLHVVTEELLDTSLHHQARPDVAARAVLEAVLERTAIGDGALAALHAEAEQAQSLARLLPAYEDAYAHLLDPDALDRAADAVRAALGPDLAIPVQEDDAWPNLATLLVRHQRCGANLLDLLRRETEDLHGARSPATLLYWRLGEPTATTPDPRLPAWITPPPAPTVQPSRPPTASTVEHERRQEVIDLNTRAFEWWQQQATQHPWADRYLRERGFTPPPEYGVAPPGWTGLVEHLRSEGVSDEAMLTAGLATRARTGRLIDRFRDRLVVPVRDGQDAIIAVAARANPDTADERTPKWLNPPATPGYTKSQVLLGLDADAQARLRAGARPVFVEGALDLEAIRRLNDPDLVPLAGCGTALTAEHLHLVRDLCPGTMRAVLAFDADTAGAQATARTWALLTDAEASLATSAILPTETDPAEMLQQQRLNHLHAGLQVAQPTAEALLDRLLAQSPHQHAEQRVATLRAAVGIAARLTDDAFVEVGDYLATRLTGRSGPWSGNGLDRETIWADLQQARAEHRACQPVPVETGNPAIAQWLRHRADQIADRLDNLVQHVAEQPPAWAADLPRAPAPEDPARQGWNHAVRAVVAYRDRFQIDGLHPLGNLAARGSQELALAPAEAALRDLGVDPRNRPNPDRATTLAAVERAARRDQMHQHLTRLRSEPVTASGFDHEALLREASNPVGADGPSIG